MRSPRTFVGAQPSRFGRARACQLPVDAANSATLSEDIQTFAATFVAGFVFVSVLIG